MFSTPDEQITRWNRKPGPRVGDWYETGCTSRRIGGIRSGHIRLASPSGRFALGPDGVTYSGLFLDHPAIPISALTRQPGSKGGAIHQPYCTMECRVFKDAASEASEASIQVSPGRARLKSKSEAADLARGGE
jgi:hypothetical protein